MPKPQFQPGQNPLQTLNFEAPTRQDEQKKNFMTAALWGSNKVDSRQFCHDERLSPDWFYQDRKK